MFDDVGNVFNIDTCEGQTVVVEDGGEGVEEGREGGGDLGGEGRAEGGGTLIGRNERGVGEDIGQPGETRPPGRRD